MPLADSISGIKAETVVNPVATKNYHARFQRALRLIDEQLEGDLGVEALSGVAAFFKFHFHRQFAERFGVGLYTYVRLARLKRACYRLAIREGSIIEIALQSG